jgi:cation transport regulator ChaC
MSAGGDPAPRVFAYGSLADPRSAALTLGERPSRRAVPATLTGWSRGFTQARDNLSCEKTFALEPGAELPAFILGLNVHPERGARVNGVLIELTDAELERLDQRELRYDRVELTEGVHPAEPLEAAPCFVYVAKPEHRALEAPLGAVILRSYAEAVEAAFEALGSAELAAYRESVLPLPAPVVDARLVEDRIPTGNPRRW